jgi:hypothetical protein
LGTQTAPDYPSEKDVIPQKYLPSGEYAVIRTRGAAHVKLFICEEVGFGVVVNQRRLRILKNKSPYF